MRFGSFYTLEIDAIERTSSGTRTLVLSSDAIKGAPILQEPFELPNRIEGAIPGRIETRITLDNTPNSYDAGVKFSDLNTPYLFQNVEVRMYRWRASGSSTFSQTLIWAGILDSIDTEGDVATIAASVRPPTNIDMAITVEESIFPKEVAGVGVPEKYFGRSLGMFFGEQWYSRPVARQTFPGGNPKHMYYFASDRMPRSNVLASESIIHNYDKTWARCTPVNGLAPWVEIDSLAFGTRNGRNVASAVTQARLDYATGVVEEIHNWTLAADYNTNNTIITRARIKWEFESTAPVGYNGGFRINIYAIDKSVTIQRGAEINRIASSEVVMQSTIGASYASSGTVDVEFKFERAVVVNHDVFNYYIGFEVVPELRSSTWNNNLGKVYVSNNTNAYQRRNNPSFNGEEYVIATFTPVAVQFDVCQLSEYNKTFAATDFAGANTAIILSDSDRGLVTATLEVLSWIVDVDVNTTRTLDPAIGEDNFDEVELIIEGNTTIETWPYGTATSNEGVDVIRSVISSWDGTVWTAPSGYADLLSFGAEVQSTGYAEKRRKPFALYPNGARLYDVLNNINSQCGYRLISIPSASGVDYFFYAWGASSQYPIYDYGPDQARVIGISMAVPESVTRQVQVIQPGAPFSITGTDTNTVFTDPKAVASRKYVNASGGLFTFILNNTEPLVSTPTNLKNFTLQGTNSTDFLAFYYAMRYSNPEIIVQFELFDTNSGIIPMNLVRIALPGMPGQGSSENARPITYNGEDVENQWRTGTPGIFPSGVVQATNVTLVRERGKERQVIYGRLLTNPAEWIYQI